MPTFNTSDLLNTLMQENQQVILDSQHFKLLSDESLSTKLHPKKWSIIECLEHLNMANGYYLEELQKTFQQTLPTHKEKFSSGIIGNMMVNNMKPIQRNNEIKIPMKMPTFATFMPKNIENKQVLSIFFKHQEELISYIEKSKEVDIEAIRIRSAIGNILRFRLGDCYRFLVAHNQRHIQQAKNVEKKLLHK